MVELVVCLLILHYIKIFLFGGRSNVLSCGLFGWASSSKDNWNALKKFKFEMLGVEMDARGGDGTGIAYDNLICKSEVIKKFDDFWRGNNVPGSLKYPTIIGHDRKASVGIKSYDNTQPICFVNKDKRAVKSILAHNGTLHNHEELFKKHKAEIHYGLDTSQMSDSQMLALLLDKVGFSILNEYIGAAAILYMDNKEPGVLYAYHGKSRTREAFVETEERPLYYATIDEDIWLCSTRYALEKVIPSKELIRELPFNEVFRIEGIKLTSVFKVDRSNCTQFAPLEKGTYYTGRYGAGYAGNYGGYAEEYACDTIESRRKNKSKQLQLPYPPKDVVPRLNELVAINKAPTTLCWDKGRFYIGDTLAQGLLKIALNGSLITNNLANVNNSIRAYYFWDGNMLKGRDEYIEAIMYRDENINKITDRELLMSIADYFVMPYIVPSIIGGDDNIMLDNEVNKITGLCDIPFTGKIVPLFSTKNLSFTNGVLTATDFSGPYSRLDQFNKNCENWPEEFYEWEKEYKSQGSTPERVIIEKPEETKGSEIVCECPECMSMGVNNKIKCPHCDGSMTVSGDVIERAMLTIMEEAEIVSALTEENKVKTAIQQVVEDGISILEEPDVVIVTRTVLNKLITIKQLLKNA